MDVIYEISTEHNILYRLYYVVIFLDRDKTLQSSVSSWSPAATSALW